MSNHVHNCGSNSCIVDELRERAERAEKERDEALAQVALLKATVSMLLKSHSNLYAECFGSAANPDDDIVRKEAVKTLETTKIERGRNEMMVLATLVPVEELTELKERAERAEADRDEALAKLSMTESGFKFFNRHETKEFLGRVRREERERCYNAAQDAIQSVLVKVCTMDKSVNMPAMMLRCYLVSEIGAEIRAISDEPEPKEDKND